MHPEGLNVPANPHRRLQVTVVDEELPYPMTSGKRIRTLNLLLRLAERHQIRVLCHRNADPAEAATAAEFLRDHGIEPILADRAAPPKSTMQGGIAFYGALATNLLSPLPYLVSKNCSVQLRGAIERTISAYATDLWHCEWTPLVQLLDGLPARPLVIAAHNVESTIWHRYYETEANPLKRWYIKHQWLKLQAFERRAFEMTDRVIAVSDCDASRIRHDFGASQVDVVDNGVDTAYFCPTGEPRDEKSILFLGSLDWRPNLDAVQLLLEQIFPLVRRSEPQARLIIVGRCPPTWLLNAAKQCPHVEVHADVSDVRPYLNRGGVMTVPLRIGGGSRLKILESLACGLPVVSTAVGAEGLALEEEIDFFEANDTTSMAARLVHCIRNPQHSQTLAQHGRQVVLGRYDWGGLALKMEQVWLNAAAMSPRVLVSA